jgi:hypothetical protein
VSTITLRASSLTSKWGFGDGDMIDEELWDLYDGRDDQRPDSHRVLYALVERYLVPELERHGYKVVLEFVNTSHNPVRAETLDGVEVDPYDGSYPELEGISITIGSQQLAIVAKELEAP